MPNKLDKNLEKLFWGDDLNTLNWDDHREYIIKTILEKGDQKAVSWLLKKVDPQHLKQRLSTYKLSPKSHHFWSFYLG